MIVTEDNLAWSRPAKLGLMLPADGKQRRHQKLGGNTRHGRARRNDRIRVTLGSRSLHLQSGERRASTGRVGRLVTIISVGAVHKDRADRHASPWHGFQESGAAREDG